jgi:hypothetical protein
MRTTIAILAMTTAIVLADTAPPQDEIFPVEKVRPGQRGIAYTVMQGSDVVALNAEIYGVLRDFIGPGIHLIVGKLVDEKTKLTGAVHGMSGSPLYIEGKLAGALSYRLTQFEKEGWCGFTPIAEMIKAGDQTKRATPVDAPSFTTSVPAGFQLASGAPTGFRPLAVPVTFGGVHPRVFDWLVAEFAKFNADGRLLPVLGGGGQEDKPLDGPFEPGAAVAGVLASGDLHAAGTGTLTWRRGNRVLGFGHPFMQIGRLAMPMARAEIVATVSSYLYPHKVANTLTAIAGEIGPLPPMAELTVNLHSARGQRKFRSRLFQHQDITPRTAATCLAQVMMDSLEHSREFFLHLRGDIELEKHDKIAIEDYYSGDRAEHFEASNELVGVLGELFYNRFETAQIKRINLDATVEENRRTVEVTDLAVDRDKAKPGDVVSLHATLKPWKGKPRVERLSFTVPAEVRAGELDVLVGNAEAADALDGKRGRERLERAQSLGQVVNLLNQRRPKNALYLKVTRRADGMVIADQRLPALPSSAMALYDSNRTIFEGSRLDRADVFETRRPLNAVVRGNRTVKVKIE